MANNGIGFGYRTPTALILPAVLLGSVAMIGLALWLTHSVSWLALLALAVLALSVALAFVWLTRFRAARRWHAVLDAYAEREIAQARQGQHPRIR